MVKTLLLGIVGKPSSGKTSFLNAACLTSAKVADYPFTTVEPNLGTAYVRTKCVCKDLGVEDNPRNSICIDGIRLVPIRFLDVPGLVIDAHKGRGLGNQFLDELRRADALIHVVDASGSLDADGNPIEPGTWDSVQDVKWLEKEVAFWLVDLIKKDWGAFLRRITEHQSIIDLLTVKLSGLAIKKSHILEAVHQLNLDPEKPKQWSDDDLLDFALTLRRIAKPMIISANKIDLPTSKEHLDDLLNLGEAYLTVPTCALGEYAFRMFSEKGYIKYIPGDSDFEILEPDKLSEKNKEILMKLKVEVLEKYGSTGVQKILDTLVFDVLEMITVYPVHDPKKFADTDGNVLPDAFLVPRGTTAKELAEIIHTDFADTFIHAMNAKTGLRISDDYELQDRDVIKIVHAAKRK